MFSRTYEWHLQCCWLCLATCMCSLFHVDLHKLGLVWFPTVAVAPPLQVCSMGRRGQAGTVELRETQDPKEAPDIWTRRRIIVLANPRCPQILCPYWMCRGFALFGPFWRWGCLTTFCGQTFDGQQFFWYGILPPPSPSCPQRFSGRGGGQNLDTPWKELLYASLMYTPPPLEGFNWEGAVYQYLPLP